MPAEINNAVPTTINVSVEVAVPGSRHYRISGKKGRHRDSQPRTLAKLNPTIMQHVLPMKRSLFSLGVDLVKRGKYIAAYRPTKSNLRRKSFQEAPCGPSNWSPFSDSARTRAPTKQIGMLIKTREAWVRHDTLRT